MDSPEKKAIEEHRDVIIDTLENYVGLLLTHLQRCETISLKEQETINVQLTSEGKLMLIIKTLTAKANGWNVLIDFLKKHQYESLVDKLQNSVAENAEVFILDRHDKNCIADFKLKLANHYISEYSRVSIGLGRHKQIEKVWVPLQIYETTETLSQDTGFNHIELIQRLTKPKSPPVALIKGHPGMGKTTLVKRIVYDWATNKVKQFSVVLAVPLRYVGPMRNYLQLAVDYYVNLFDLSENDRGELQVWLRQLGRQLLICFDGLDEYRDFCKSPFKTLFAEKFRKSPTGTVRRSAPSIPYHLLITSRPYACNLVNRDFYPLEFEVSIFHPTHLAEFVQLYCETVEGAARVTKNVVDANLVIKVPLILAYVCFLADINEEISSNLTKLYQRFLFHMVKRQVDGPKLSEELDIHNWVDMEVVKSTARLAHHGCENDIFEFPKEVQNEFGVNDDSFKCGFLLHRFDLHQDNFNSDFPHRSIQEFFAALHSYKLFSTDDRTQRNAIMKQILKYDSQFGRFFFGICTDHKNFRRALDWLNPTFEDAKMCYFDIYHFLSLFSCSLSDCSEAEAVLLGRRLTASLDLLQLQITTERNEKINLDLGDFPDFNKSFKAGLHLTFFAGEGDSWSLTDVKNPEWSRLTSITNDPPANLEENFKRIQMLMWYWGRTEVAEMVSSLNRLPPVETLIVKTGVQLEVNFKLERKETATVATELQNFSFGFDEEDIPMLKKQCSLQLETDELMIRDTRKTGDEEEITWGTVTIEENLELSQLVTRLIQLALQIAI